MQQKKNDERAKKNMEKKVLNEKRRKMGRSNKPDLEEKKKEVI